MAVVDVGGLTIGYDRRGNGPPLVLVHGAVCDRRVWEPEVEDLADEFTVLAWDAPGCGESSDPPEGFSLADYAACLARLLAVLGLGAPHVVGHSWGGAVTLQLGCACPELPASLVVAGGYAGWAGSLPAQEVARRLAFAVEAAERMPAGFEPRTMRGVFSSRIPAQRAAVLASVMADARPVGTRVMARGLAEADLREDLRRITAPTLLLYGAADERAPRPVGESLHAAIAGSRLVLLPGAGHEMFLEAPQACRAEVRRFVRSVQQGARAAAGL